MSKPDYQIVNIRFGKGARSKYCYANIVDASDNNRLCVSATLDYCVDWVKERLNAISSDL